jgi:hypothetical protein
MPNLLNLPRNVLAQMAQGNQQAVYALEQVLGAVGGTFPSTIEEANALAGSALAVAQTAVASLSVLADALARLESTPIASPQVDADDMVPRPHLGTITGQNADSVEITGGTIDNTPIGATTAADAKFKKVAASDQITSTVATGTAPLVVTSTTRVANLNVAAAGTADSLTSPTSYPAAATDLPTVIALANALRAANIAKGV